MIQKITDFFTKNIVWKIVSLFLAFILWFVAVNIENPVDRKNYYTRLQVINKEELEKNGLVLLNMEEIEDTQIRVRISTSASIHSRLSDRNVIAYIDMGPASYGYESKIGVVQKPQVEISLTGTGVSLDDFEDYQATPLSLEIVLDYYESIEHDINVKVTRYAQDGYVIMDPITSPETLIISGARSLLESIAEVSVELSIDDDISDDYLALGVPVVYDANGKDITDKLELSANEVQIMFPVYKYQRIPVNMPEIRGYVADGYTITNVELSQDYVEAVGKDEDLASLTYIVLDSVNVAGASQNVSATREVSQVLREHNLNTRDGTSSAIEITVYIEKLETVEVTFPVAGLQIVGDGEMLSEGEVPLTIQATQEMLNNLDLTAVTGIVNVEGLEAGTHEVPVVFELPGGLVHIGDLPTVAVQVASGDEASPEPMESEMPEETENGDGEGAEPETNEEPQASPE